ncbi:MAG: MATE family efflux transporter [Eubacteriales bacterium]|nr:MATE family efflux transporter [Eubacteriales bacterium]
MSTRESSKLQSETNLMTEGPVWKRILFFSLPLMVGNLFQQFYNTVDSIVVGNFVGKEALAAVGSTDSVINTFIGFFSGMATGAGVVISQYYGARQEEKVERSVHTTIALTFLMSLVCTVCALLLVPSLLRLMGTPDDVFDQAASYLRIYFIGVTGLLFYNMGSGILRAVGDSRRPLYFLIFSAILNVILDLVFVAVLGMGTAGVGLATVLSQGVSALLILFVLTREKACYRISWRQVRLDMGMTRRIFRVGLPAAVQMAVTSFSNVFVQSYINRFGSAAMAGWSSYGKIDKFCLLPIQSLALGVTTFAGQNLGARKLDRVRQGTRTGTLLCFAVALCIVVPVWIFARPLVSLFNRTPEVLDYGTLFVRLEMPFYLALCVNQVYAGTLRGIGNSKAPMVIMMGCFILFRQIYLFTVTQFTDSIIPVALGYPLGWLLCSVCLFFYYRNTKLEHYTLLK